MADSPQAGPLPRPDRPSARSGADETLRWYGGDAIHDKGHCPGRVRRGRESARDGGVCRQDRRGWLRAGRQPGGSPGKETRRRIHPGFAAVTLMAAGVLQTGLDKAQMLTGLRLLESMPATEARPESRPLTNAGPSSYEDSRCSEWDRPPLGSAAGVLRRSARLPRGSCMLESMGPTAVASRSSHCWSDGGDRCHPSA